MDTLVKRVTFEGMRYVKDNGIESVLNREMGPACLAVMTSHMDHTALVTALARVG
jgi:hypothetical protein